MSVINSGPKRKNYSDHSNYSYSGIGPKERALNIDCMEHYIVHRGSIVWNGLSVHYNNDNIQSVQSYCKMAKKVDTLHRMDFNAPSI